MGRVYDHLNQCPYQVKRSYISSGKCDSQRRTNSSQTTESFHVIREKENVSDSEFITSEERYFAHPESPWY
jgi:hypothetical protein